MRRTPRNDEERVTLDVAEKLTEKEANLLFRRIHAHALKDQEAKGGQELQEEASRKRKSRVSDVDPSVGEGETRPRELEFPNSEFLTPGIREALREEAYLK